MNKKLILLMLALPLILMLSLFTTTSTVSLAVSVPVSKVVFNEDPIIYIDLEESYEISYTIYPTNAANQKVIFSTEPYGEGSFAGLTVQDGKVIPSSCGTAKLTVTTVDGGFKDSVIIEISTNNLQSISTSIVTLENETIGDSINIKIGEEVKIATKFSPAAAQYQTQLKYEIVEGSEVVSVNLQGKITGKNVGKAKIKTYCTIDNSVYDEVEITVENSNPIEFLTKTETLTNKDLTGDIHLYVDESAEFESINYKVLDEYGAEYSAIACSLDKTNKIFSYQFKNEDTCVVTVHLSAIMKDGSEYSDECKIIRVGKIECEWVDGGADGDKTHGPTAVAIGQSEEVYFNILPPNKEFAYEITLSENGKYVECEVHDGYIFVKPSATALEYLEGIQADETVTLTIWLVEEPNVRVTLTRIINVYLPN